MGGYLERGLTKGGGKLGKELGNNMEIEKLDVIGNDVGRGIKEGK